jgi:hypothetical protein
MKNEYYGLKVFNNAGMTIPKLCRFIKNSSFFVILIFNRITYTRISKTF